MSDYHKDLLLEVIDGWTDGQLYGYIKLQEDRLEHTRELIRTLKDVQRKRKKKKVVDTGARDGR